MDQVAAHTISYTDSRGLGGEPVPFTQAVVNGIAPGGGLYVPETIPTLTLEEITRLSGLPYHARAALVYRRFGVDLDVESIDALMERAYGSAFDTPAICPIRDLGDGRHVLELWHGPTCAFKDMALQCMPLFFTASAQKLKAEGKLDHDFLILVATSGDTGSAALAGFADVEGASIAVLYPDGGTSDIQKLQMTTQSGANVCVWGVRGNFDDCQTTVKAIFGDAEEAERLLNRYSVALSSANSINWGRLAPQIVYYLSSYGELVARGVVESGDPIDVCVPTGNFGNILAAWYAKAMGAPFERLLCASNENNVLTDFIDTGVYDIADRTFHLTPSPSMDILVSSNLERQLFELSGRDANAIRGWMEDLQTKRRFEVNERTAAELKRVFAADYVDNDTCLATIADIHRRYDYLVDPHTAVACKVAERLAEKRPVLVASTAHWAKFGANVYRALNGIAAGDPLPQDIAALDGCALNRLLSETANSAIPAPLEALEGRMPRFTTVIDGDKPTVEAACEAFLATLSR